MHGLAPKSSIPTLNFFGLLIRYLTFSKYLLDFEASLDNVRPIGFPSLDYDLGQTTSQEVAYFHFLTTFFFVKSQRRLLDFFHLTIFFSEIATFTSRLSSFNEFFHHQVAYVHY